MAKKRNPSDLTKRNNDARKKEIAALRITVKDLREAVILLVKRVKVLEAR